MDYSKDINSLLGNPKSLPSPAIEDPQAVLQVNLLLCWFFGFLVAPWLSIDGPADNIR